MKELGPYNADLQMFVEKPRDISMPHLQELRWRRENGLRFGHPLPVSVPRGDFVFKLSDTEIKRYAMMQGDAELKPLSQYEQTIK